MMVIIHYTDMFLEDIPKTDVYHHVVEDFVTNW